MKYFLSLVTFFVVQCMTLQAGGRDGFRLVSDTAQYKGSDYSNVVQVARSISLEQAFEIAENNPEIDYFVYLKGCQMVLEIPSDTEFHPRNDRFGLVTKVNFRWDSGEFGYGYCRIFQHGDTVFFKKDGMWLGSAIDLADTYFKE